MHLLKNELSKLFLRSKCWNFAQIIDSVKLADSGKAKRATASHSSATENRDVCVCMCVCAQLHIHVRVHWRRHAGAQMAVSNIVITISSQKVQWLEMHIFNLENFKKSFIRVSFFFLFHSHSPTPKHLSSLSIWNRLKEEVEKQRKSFLWE